MSSYHPRWTRASRGNFCLEFTQAVSHVLGKTLRFAQAHAWKDSYFCWQNIVPCLSSYIMRYANLYILANRVRI